MISTYSDLSHSNEGACDHFNALLRSVLNHFLWSCCTGNGAFCFILKSELSFLLKQTDSVDKCDCCLASLPNTRVTINTLIL
jgi:hypothetical protein